MKTMRGIIFAAAFSGAGGTVKRGAHVSLFLALKCFLFENVSCLLERQKFMSRKTSVLDRVSVKEPCREDWNAMIGNAQVRFCSHCAKSVHNLSAMTRAEAERLISLSNARLCVRYVRRTDKNIATAPEVPFIKITRRASKLAATAFTAALTFTSAPAQTSDVTTQTTNNETVISDNHCNKSEQAARRLLERCVTHKMRLSPKLKSRLLTQRAAFVKRKRTMKEIIELTLCQVAHTRFEWKLMASHIRR